MTEWPPAAVANCHSCNLLAQLIQNDILKEKTLGHKRNWISLGFRNNLAVAVSQIY